MSGEASLPERTLRVSVIGNGGFGTALAVHAHHLGHQVRLWGNDYAYTRRMAETRANPRYLPGVPLPPEIGIGSDPAEILEGAEAILSVVPTQHVRTAFEKLAAEVAPDVPVISCSKGMEQSTGLLPSQILADLLPGDLIYVLSGPCHAEELVRGKPASLVLAGPEGAELVQLQKAFSGPTFRLYRGTDPLGVELAGALKNIVAIAAGIGDGLELGDNAKSALLTRGLYEIGVFGVAMGAQQETFFGLAGMGDLITTAISPHGRNRAIGERLGRGETLDEILATTNKVAEGVWTTRAVLERAQELGIEMPIAEEVGRVLFEEEPVQLAVTRLMSRLLREEGGWGEE